MANYNSLRFGSYEEDTQFPEVSFYNYPDNLKVRGISNREFRWQDVYVKTNYLLREATIDGTFELNSFQSGITTPQSIDGTGFTYWTATGINAYHIGISGTFFSAYNSWAYPIVNDNAVMLNATGTSVSIRHTGLTTGSIMPLARYYQVYLSARSLVGTGTITPYVVAKLVDTETAYYDPFSGAWETSAPTGTYSVLPTGYTEILYNFYTTDITGSIPDSFDLVIAQASGAAYPVIIDDAHIDEVLVRNPYVDYFIPTGYMFQVTPDIGWHDIRSMFETTGNPYLKTLGIYSVEAGNLSDMLDGSVKATIDTSDFSSSLYSNYSKYYWRAVAVSPNGELGDAGIPQKFTYIGTILDDEFEVISYTEDETSITKIIDGKKPERSIILVDGHENDLVEYPTNRTWRFKVEMESQIRDISFKAQDSGGATSSTYKITLKCRYFDTQVKTIWNTFDDHGLLMDIERLPGESNQDFYDRIKDVNRSPSGVGFSGIVNGASRELGLKRISNALNISIITNFYSQKKNVVSSVVVGASSLKIRSSIDQYTELCFIKPVYSEVVLTKCPYRILQIIDNLGNIIPEKEYTILVDEDSESLDYKVSFLNRNYDGLYVSVIYDYYNEYRYTSYPTLYDIYSAINSTLDASGNRYVSCEMDLRLSGGESCLGLYKTSKIITSTESQEIDWSPVYLNRLSDREFRKYFLTNTSLYKTKYADYVKQLKNDVKIFWGSVECDRSYWGISSNIKNSLDHIPTILDPIKSNWVQNINGSSTGISSSRAWALGYLTTSGDLISNFGTPPSYFKPGIGYINDLIPNINIQDNIPANQTLSSNPVSPSKNSNKVLYFSGQR